MLLQDSETQRRGNRIAMIIGLVILTAVIISLFLYS